MTKKTIIITGASGKLGHEAVKNLSKEDYNIVAVSNGNKCEVENSDILFLQNMDLINPDHAKIIVSKTLEVFGSIYGLINIAGGFVWKTLDDTSLDDINHMFDINFKTTFNMTKSVLPHLKENNAGRIITIGAIGATKLDVGMASYAISKAAVMNYTEVLSKETPSYITVNSILPSIIDTEQNRIDIPDANWNDWDTTTEISNQISFLLSDMAGSINGHLIPMTSKILKGYDNVQETGTN